MVTKHEILKEAIETVIRNLEERCRHPSNPLPLNDPELITYLYVCLDKSEKLNE